MNLLKLKFCPLVLLLETLNFEGSVFDLRKSQWICNLLKGTHAQFNMTRHIDYTFPGQKLVLEKGIKN